MNEKLSFPDFIKTHFEYYQVDASNSAIISQLSMWANRDETFSAQGDGFHLNKGIMLMGDIGTGKTDLFRLLHEYLGRYLRSNYDFKYEVVWKFASEFSQHGHQSFRGQESENRYYDELCLIDGRSKNPLREYATYYGNKLLVGEELIMFRYNSFKFSGWLSHFSTNTTPEQLRDVYDDRAYSRLTEMCNFMNLVGDDRRAGAKPTFYNNKNEPKESPRTSGRLVSDEEHQYNKDMMDQVYAMFLGTGTVTDLAAIHYDILKSYGCKVDEATDVLAIESKASSEFTRELRLTPSMTEEERSFYREPTQSEISADKSIFIKKETKKQMVLNYYTSLRATGAKTIFGEKNLKITAEATDQIKIEEVPGK